MKITIRFNVAMTLAILVQHSILELGPGEGERPWILRTILDTLDWTPMAKAITAFFLILSAWMANMFLCRALWNRLFPRLCGWNPIRLSEAYALSLLLGLL